jgi:hypothetical protein
VDAELTCRRAEQESIERTRIKNAMRQPLAGQRHAQSRCRCGRGKPRAGADVAALGPEFLFGRIALQKGPHEPTCSPSSLMCMPKTAATTGRAWSLVNVT